MNGELLLIGYKFTEKLILNLQDKTILTGQDTFIAFEIFNMLENYFNRKNFSDYYLDKGTTLILNGNKLSGDEFAVFRLRSTVDLSEELKINKKSILGQIVQSTFSEADDRLSIIEDVIRTNVLCHLNALTEDHGVLYTYEENDIISLCKNFSPVVKEEGGQDVLLQEHDQFFCKALLVDFITKLKIKKKKMLLVELPGYGLRDEETLKLFNLLIRADIDNVIIYTQRSEISKVMPHVYNYSVVRNGGVYGFDDYDILEQRLQSLFNKMSEKQIEAKVLEYIFKFQYEDCNCGNCNDDFGLIVNEFLLQ